MIAEVETGGLAGGVRPHVEEVSKKQGVFSFHKTALHCEISPLLCKAAWDTFQVTIVIVTCHQTAKGQECMRMVVIVCSHCGEESFIRKSHL